MVRADLERGALTNRVKFENCPFDLRAGEVTVWVAEATRFEAKTKVSYRGGSQGGSFRVAKDVSFRVGGSKALREETALFLLSQKVAGCPVENLVLEEIHRRA